MLSEIGNATTKFAIPKQTKNRSFLSFFIIEYALNKIIEIGTITDNIFILNISDFIKFIYDILLLNVCIPNIQ